MVIFVMSGTLLRRGNFVYRSILGSMRDPIDEHIELWSRELPALDPRIEGIVTRMQWLDQYRRNQLGRALASQGLKLWEFKTLHVLRRSGAPYRATTTDLAGELDLSPAAMTKRLDNLEQGGYLRRTHDTADRRRILVTLTDAGHRAWEKTISLQDRVERELVEALSPDEQDQLVALLRRLVLSAKGPAPFAPSPRPARSVRASSDEPGQSIQDQGTGDGHV
jgi:DNA-binding MarR family transcriptional regulator